MIKFIFNKFLSLFFGIEIINSTFKNKILTQLNQYKLIKEYNINFLLEKYNFDNQKIKKLKSNSNSSNLQDLFVLSQLNFKKNGYFVEFGVIDGIVGSNTLLLEKEYGWDGIVVEPSREFEKVKKNRKCIKDNRCIYNKSGQFISFTETDEKGLSTISAFKSSDYHYKSRKKNYLEYKVETITLNLLLEENASPSIIDYLSIDTEGSEFLILSAFNFDKYSFKIISVEHNYQNQRTKLYDLLTKNGYKRVFEGISDIEDWYINPKYLKN